MKAAVLVFPGSNCDRDAARALADYATGPVDLVWHEEPDFKEAPDLIVLPGGFAYGDYLRTGALAALSPIMKAVRRAAGRGALVVGICNGFQILTEAGLLPGALLPNTGLHFICDKAYMKVERTDTPFSSAFAAGQVVQFPIAHHEGLYFLPPKELLDLEKNRQVLFRYADPDSGQAGVEQAPNGSLNGIAGIVNRDGNVLGLMPHPERATLEHLNSGVDGRLLWESIKAHIHQGKPNK